MLIFMLYDCLNLSDSTSLVSKFNLSPAYIKPLILSSKMSSQVQTQESSDDRSAITQESSDSEAEIENLLKSRANQSA